MHGRFFLDSNIVLYSFSDDAIKRRISGDMLGAVPVVSTQVISETANVLRYKMKIDPMEIIKILDSIFKKTEIIPVLHSTIREALRIGRSYRYSHYDCQIIASALESGCDVLYSEDLHESHQIDDRLIIVNPFVSYYQKIN